MQPPSTCRVIQFCANTRLLALMRRHDHATALISTKVHAKAMRVTLLFKHHSPCHGGVFEDITDHLAADIYMESSQIISAKPKTPSQKLTLATAAAAEFVPVSRTKQRRPLRAMSPTCARAHTHTHTYTHHTAHPHRSTTQESCD